MANFFPQSFRTAKQSKVTFRFRERRKWQSSSSASYIQLHLLSEGVVHGKDEDETWEEDRRKGNRQATGLGLVKCIEKYLFPKQGRSLRVKVMPGHLMQEANEVFEMQLNLHEMMNRKDHFLTIYWVITCFLMVDKNC